MPREVEIVTVAEASEDHPRNGGADMIELADGSIFMSRMLIHKSGLKEGAGDDVPLSDLISIVSRDCGRTWGEQKTFLKPAPDETAAYCPGLIRLRSGEILYRFEMYHHFVVNEPWSITAYAAFSTDECETFSAPVTIFSRSSHHAGSMNDLRQLSTGRIVIPTVYMEGTALQDEGKGLAPSNTSVAGTYYSDDEGRTWTECDGYVYLPMRGCMEPKIAELKDGRLMMVMRTQLGSVFQSFSTDGGANWSKPQTTGLQSPESCPLLMRIPRTQDLLIIWNDSPYDPRFDHYGVRSPLSAAISKDDGVTWSPSRAIETDPEWEFTNPAAIVTRDGNLLVAYEASKYASLDPPGKLGRTLMSLKLAIIELDWLYE